MNTAKVYLDADGRECTIWQMVRREPEWAANRIQEGEKALEKLEKLEKQNEEMGHIIEGMDLCCCGNAIKDHGYTDNHSAVSMLDHHIACRVEAHTKVLKEQFDWKPMATAPKDGRLLLLKCESGYSSFKGIVLVSAYWPPPDYRDNWLTVANDRLSDYGYEPLAWMEVPE